MTTTQANRKPNKFAGRCRCGTPVEAGTGFLGKKIDGRWTVECGACAGVAPDQVDVTAASPHFPLTEEQQHAVDLFSLGETIAVEAGAGTGKTSTLVAIAKSTKRVGQYVAFNKAIVRDAAEKMPRNVACATAHALAYRTVGKRFSHRLDGPRMRSEEVARRLGLRSYVVTFGQETKTLQPGFLAGRVLKAVLSFCNSADDRPRTEHFEYVDGIDLPTAEGKRTYSNNDKLRLFLLPYVDAAWTDLTNPEGQLPYRPDHYLKLWQLTDPRIPGDFILFDEAQDASPVLVAAVAAQDKQVVWVGDSQQAIYEWRGAVNALANVPSDSRAFLTNSFRFGPEIAAVANEILGTIESAQLRLIGAGAAGVVGPAANPRAILTRTNAGAIEAVLDALEAGKKPHLVGGGGEVAAFARGAKELQETGSTEHPDLACFESWGQVQEYVQQDPMGTELALMVRLIDKYDVDTILEAVDNPTPEAQADVVVSTAHKSKGREWDVVQVAGDFAMDRDDDGERRLRYVAATRARKHLDATRCGPIMELIDPDFDREAFDRQWGAR